MAINKTEFGYIDEKNYTMMNRDEKRGDCLMEIAFQLKRIADKLESKI